MKHLRSLFLPLALFSLIAYSPMNAQDLAPKKVTATSGYYIFTYRTNSLNLDLLINGYKIEDNLSNRDTSGQADVNYWILPGKNLIKYRVTNRTGKKKESFGSPKVNFELTIAQTGQMPDEGEQMLSFSWTNETGDEKSVSGAWQIMEFETPFSPPSKLWSIAEKIVWTPELEKSALVHVEALLAALNSKNPAKVSPFIEFREKDTSETRYFPYKPEEDKKNLEGMMKAIGSTWKLNKKKIVPILLCDNKIVSLTDGKGNSILKGGKGASLPLNLSLVDGKWLISR